MYTRCPTCSTCFRVTDRHLSIAKGKVRCGQCQLVFNAPEHAIDDLPINQITTPSVPPVAPAAKTEVKQPLAPKKEITDNPILSSPRSKTEEKPVYAPSTTQEINNEIKEDVIEQAIDTPAFNSNATIITDESTLNINEAENIELDSPSAIQDNNDDEDDDLFDDSFDLNAAIDELTQEGDNEIIHLDEENETIDEQEQYIPDNNKDDVFDTGAYVATNATSVADILNEMEGQLSLNIEAPKDNEEYDVNSEFDFLELDDDLDESNITTDKKSIDEFDFMENNIDSQVHIENEFIDTKQSPKKEPINENKLSDRIDLSDFQDSNLEENIILEDSLSNNDELQNIGQHANKSDVPFQLRNDIKNLQTNSKRHWHPLFGISTLIVLIIFSLFQLTYFRAHELVNLIPSSRPMLEAFCEKIECHYSGPRDTKKIQLLSRDVRLHPKEKKALLISAAMINNAHFAQPYPNIHVRLSDISGNVVAERIFNSKTYMGKLSNPFLLMKSKTPVHINFEVVDPGKDAVNFEFTFL